MTSIAFFNSLYISLLGVVILFTKDGTWWGVLGVVLILSGIIGMAQVEETWNP